MLASLHAYFTLAPPVRTLLQGKQMDSLYIPAHNFDLRVLVSSRYYACPHVLVISPLIEFICLSAS